jgi:hypothetical protein
MLKPMALNSSSPKTPSPDLIEPLFLRTHRIHHLREDAYDEGQKPKRNVPSASGNHPLQIKKKDEDNPLEKNRFLHIENRQEMYSVFDRIESCITKM